MTRAALGEAQVHAARRSVLLRRLTALGVLVSAAVHLFLYFDGFNTIDVIGPLFLLNGIGGLFLGVAVLMWHHPIWLLAAAGFCASTLGAFLLSATVGLMGVHEPFFGYTQTTAFLAELIGLISALAALATWWRRRA